MKSYQVRSFGEPLAAVEHDIPQPHGGEVVLQVVACGACHSDVHLHDGYFDLGGGTRLDAERIISPPRTLGHEILGRVTALGAQASGVAPGDRRVVFPWIGCGECTLCAAGNEHLCNRPAALGVHRDGGFAQYVVVPDARYLLEFDPLAPEQACTYACSGLTAYSALRKVAGLGAGDPLLIIGAGGVGLSGVRLAKELYGIAPIVAETDQRKWDLAREAGAGEVIDPSADGAVKSLVKATRGGVAAAIDFVGADTSFDFGFKALAKGGRLVCVGLFGGAVAVSPALIAMKAVTVIGSYVGSLAEMHELMAIARSGALPDLPVTTRPLEEVDDALADLKQGKVRGRVVLMAGDDPRAARGSDGTNRQTRPGD